MFYRFSVYVCGLLIMLVNFTFASGIPQMINFQGRVSVGGSPFNGTGTFKFAIIDNPTVPNSYYWTNDGTGSPPNGVPTGGVSITVNDGIFNVILGDTSLNNMEAIPESVFTNGDTFLRIWFNDGVSGEAIIESGQRLTSVPYAFNGVPKGAILMWSGALSNIPSGWALCDGTNGTPDLREKFIYGWSDGVNPGATGGSSTHTHVCQSSGTHTHTLSYYSSQDGMNCTGAGGSVSGCHTHWYHKTTSPTNSAGSHSHTIENANHLPPYYKLAFIMKL